MTNLAKYSPIISEMCIAYNIEQQHARLRAEAEEDARNGRLRAEEWLQERERLTQERLQEYIQEQERDKKNQEWLAKEAQEKDRLDQEWLAKVAQNRARKAQERQDRRVKFLLRNVIPTTLLNIASAAYILSSKEAKSGISKWVLWAGGVSYCSASTFMIGDYSPDAALLFLGSLYTTFLPLLAEAYRFNTDDIP